MQNDRPVAKAHPVKGLQARKAHLGGARQANAAGEKESVFRADLVVPVGQLLMRHASERGNKCAFRDPRGSVTYAEIDRRTAAFAGSLADLGVAVGDHVAILLPNGVAWAESCLGIVRAGAVAVPISAEARAAEVAYRLTDAGCVAVVTHDAAMPLLATLASDLPSLKYVISVDGAANGALAYHDLAKRTDGPAPRDPDALDEPSFLIYTSGTTGKPKGVRLTCRSMLWVTAACWAPVLGLSHDDTLLGVLPLYHSYALNLCVLSVVATGATIHFMDRYSTGPALDLLASGEFTLFPGVPTMFHYLIEGSEKAGSRQPAGLRACISAGAILPGALAQAFEQRFGIPLLDGYGITETSTMVTLNPAQGARPAGSCGMPLPGLAVRIVDPATGRDCDAGQEGELIVRGPNLMLGYLNKPEETAKAIRDGWYHTGDLARADRNGFLSITGRIKELIIRGGQNIAPAEIEEVVQQLDQVVDCAAVGLPDERLGEIPGLFVIARDGQTDCAAIAAHCRQHLSAYKVPPVIELVDSIPRTGSGKIIRFQLREDYLARRA